jgi:hypothetical protein
LRHPIQTVINAVENRTQLSVIILQAALGYSAVLMLCTMQVRPTTSILFVLLFPLLWGPPLGFFAFWLISWISWIFGKITGTIIERGKLSLLQAWALSPFIYILLLMVLVNLPIQLKLYSSSDIPDFVGIIFITIACCPLLAFFAAYFGGMIHLHDSSKKRAFFHSLFDVAVTFVLLLTIMYLLTDKSLSALI